MIRNNFVEPPDLQSRETQVLTAAHQGQVSQVIQLSIHYFNILENISTVDSPTAQKTLLLRILKIAYFQTLRDQNKTGVLTLLSLRNNVLPLIADHGFRVEFLVIIFNILSCFSRSMGKFKRAIYHIDQAQVLISSVWERHMVMMTLNNYGAVLLNMGILKKAGGFFRKAISLLASESGNRKKSVVIGALCYNNLGVTSYALGEFDGFRSAFAHAFELQNQVPNAISTKIKQNFDYLNDEKSNLTLISRTKSAGAFYRKQGNGQSEKSLKDYVTLIMDLSENMELLGLFEDDAPVRMIPRSETSRVRPRIEAPPETMGTTENMSQVKTDFDIVNLETRGILTWEPLEEISYKGERLFQTLKLMEERAFPHEITGKPQKEIIADHFKRETNKNAGNFPEINKVKTSYSNFFNENEERPLKASVNLKSSGLSEKKAHETLITSQPSDKKAMENSEKHRNDSSHYTAENLEKSSEIHSQNHEEKNKAKTSNAKENNEKKRVLKKFQSENKINIHKSEQNLHQQKTKKTLTASPEKPLQRPSKPSEYTYENNYHRILLIHEEVYERRAARKTPPLYKSDFLLKKGPKNGKKPRFFGNETPDGRVLVENGTQIDPEVIGIQRFSVKKSEKTVNFTSETEEILQRSQPSHPGGLYQYSPQEIEKVRKVQFFWRRFRSKKPMNRRETRRIRISCIIRLQRIVRVWLATKKLRFSITVRRNFEGTECFGAVLRKIEGEYHKFSIFKKNEQVYYLVTPNPQIFRFPLDSFACFTQGSPRLQTLTELKAFLPSVITLAFPNLKPCSQPSESIRKDLIASPEIYRQDSKLLKTLSRQISIDFPSILKNSKFFMNGILRLQRCFRQWLYKLHKKQRKIIHFLEICQRVDKISKEEYLLVQCFRDLIHQQIIIVGRFYSGNKTILLKTLQIAPEILNFLKDPLSRDNLWDMLAFDPLKRSFEINEELAYKIEVSNNVRDSKGKKKVRFSIFGVLILQKKIRAFLNKKKRECAFMAKASNKKSDITRHFKVFSNEIFLLKAQTQDLDSDKISLKINGFAVNKSRKTLKTEFEVPFSAKDVGEMARQILKTAQIRRSINKDFFIHFDEKIIQNMEDFTPGYGSAFLKFPYSSFELRKPSKLPSTDPTRQAVLRISKGWIYYKGKLAFSHLRGSLRKSDKLHAATAFTEEIRQKLARLQKNKEDESMKEQEAAVQLQKKALICEVVRQFTEEIVYLIRIFYNSEHNSLVIFCEPQPKDRESSEFHIPLHILGIQEIPSLEQFKAVYVRGIIHCLVWENGQLVQKFVGKTATSQVQSKSLDLGKSKAVGRERKTLTENTAEVPEKQVLQNNDSVKIQERKSLLKPLQSTLIQSFSLVRNDRTFMFELRYIEAEGVFLLLSSQKDRVKICEKELRITWFESLSAPDKEHLRKVLTESTDFPRFVSIRPNKSSLKENRFSFEIDLRNENQRLFLLLQKRLELRKSAVRLQQAWRRHVIKAIISKALLAGKNKLVSVQIQAIKSRYFRLINFLEEDKSKVLVKCLEIPSKERAVAFTACYSIELRDKSLRNVTFLSQVLKESVRLIEKEPNEFGLQSKNPGLLKVLDFTAIPNPLEPNALLSYGKPSEKNRKVGFKNSIYLTTRLIFFFRTFKHRMEFLKHREIRSLRRNAPIFLKTMIIKKNGYYLTINCFFNLAEQKIILSFINLNLSKLVNCRYSVEFFWKTYPNRVEINRVLNQIKENLFFNFVFGNLTVSLPNTEYQMVEALKKVKKREALSEQGKKLMQFINSIILIQRALRKKNAREMREIRLKANQIKQTLIKLKNGKLNLTKALKLGDEYYRVHIYQNEEHTSRFSISARPLVKTSKELKTVVEMDDSTLLNTEGEGIERFFVRNLVVENGALKLAIPMKLQHINENPKENVEVNENEDFRSPMMMKYDIPSAEILEESPSPEEKFSDYGKKKDFENFKKVASKAEIVHQEEIDGHLFNIYYQNSEVNSKAYAGTGQKTVQIDVTVDDLKTYNPNFSFSQKDSLKNVAELLAKSIKVNQTQLLIDSRTINPDALKMRRLGARPESMITSRLLETKVNQTSHFQSGVQKLIRIMNEKRKVILKQTKIGMNSRQYLIVINYLERPLRKIDVTGVGSKEDFLEDYEVLFEIRAVFTNEGNSKSFIQVDLTLGELTFLCQLNLPYVKEKAQNMGEYQYLVNSFVEKLALINDKFIFEIRYRLDYQKKLRLNQLAKKLAKTQKKLLFVNLVAIRKLQTMFRNKGKAKSYKIFRSETLKNKKIIGKIGFVNEEDEFIVILKDLNSYDLELSAWDVRTFAVKNSLNLKKELYERHLSLGELKRGMLEVMKWSISVAFMPGSQNRSLVIYYDEEKALKQLEKEGKTLLKRIYKENLRREKGEEVIKN